MTQLTRRHYPLFFWVGITFGIVSCQPMGTYEKVVPITSKGWKSDYKPTFEFFISDTASPYNTELMLRHHDRYHYSNIWIRLYLTDPEMKTDTLDTELSLGSNEVGWLGTGINDIYQHRISLNAPLEKKKIRFSKKGLYRIKIEQLMREDPLQEVRQVGIRVEKKP